MHVGAAFVFGWNAVDGACHLAIHQNDALVALSHFLQVFLGDEGFIPEGTFEQFKER